jgi:hypothetical protein
MGEDGNLIIYNFNNYQQNKDSKLLFRDEILAKEVLLKEQVISFLRVEKTKRLNSEY